MPELLALEFQVDPAPERNPEDGYVLLLEMERQGSDSNARCWFARGHWMERPETEVLRSRQPAYLPRKTASEIFERLSLISVKPLPPDTVGFHSTKYRLTSTTFASPAAFVWWHELPKSWEGLETPVAQLTSLAANAAASEA